MRSIVRQFHTLSRIGIRKGARRLFQIGGLQGIELPDPRIISYITVDPFLIEWKMPGMPRQKGGPLFRDDLDFESCAITVEAYEQKDYRTLFLHEVFGLGVDLRDTTEFRHQMDVIARKGRARGILRTEAQVLDYLNGKVRMVKEIRKSGMMRPSRQISGRRGDEIGCVVDHRGRILKGENGNNRFAIARMLGIRTVPVQIDAIHHDQMDVINELPGWTPIGRFNAWLAQLQDRYAPPVEARSAGRAAGRLSVSPAE